MSTGPQAIRTMKSIAELREDYTLGGLSEAEAGDNPLALFRLWFDSALTAGLKEPNAMTLATCTLDGKPSARIVLLKGLDDVGFTFFTNYDSRKGRELELNPHAALCFLWHEFERQVRIEGIVTKVSEADSDEYFRNRPLGSRLGAWASPQSAVIPDRGYLERLHRQLMEKYPNGAVPRPAHWGGYRLAPHRIEFWQGRPSRLHDRICFRMADSGWIRERLAP
jgi:pyridoxamine 5'-phosphate oxidase